MSSLIEKQQDFKGSINEVPFEREEVFDATASIVNAIEHRWPITCSKETIEAIKGYVEGHEALHPSFSFKKFERENTNRIAYTTENTYFVTVYFAVVPCYGVYRNKVCIFCCKRRVQWT